MRKFEELKLGIESMAVEDVDDAPNIGAMEGKPSTTTRSLPGAHTSKFGRTRFATGGLPLQDEESTRSLSSRDLATATRSSPNAQSNLTKSLATSPSAAVNNVFINTSIQTNIAMPPVQERGIPTTEAPIVFEQEVLFKQLEHYSMLIKNLLKEVDEAQYKITFKSRLRVKGGIAGLHESERQELERIWGVTALQSAEQRLESLVEGLGEMPMINRVAAGDPGDALPTGYMGIISALPITADLGLGDEEQEEAADRTPHPIPDLRLSQLNPGIGVSTVEGPSNMLVPINEAVAKGGRFLGVYEDKRLPTETTAGAYTRDYSVVDQQQRAPRFKSHHPQQLMLSKARVADPHKNQSNNGNRAPAAPVISYAPCSYRGQSPQGVPRFDGPTKNELTQEKLVLPAPKKRRASNNVTSPSVPAQAPTNLADLGLRAAAADAAAGYVNRNARKSEAQDRRSRSRTRRNSINAIRTFREADDAAQNSAYRDKKIAQAGLADAAVAGLVERARSKSRGGEKRNRSKSRIRQGLPVAATGLGSTAIAGLYEKIRAGKKDKEDNKAQYTEKDDATALDEHLSHSREERTAESEEKVGSNGDQLALQLQDTTDSLDGFFDVRTSFTSNYVSSI